MTADSPQRFEEVPFRDYLRRVREIESGGEVVTCMESRAHGWLLTIVPEERFIYDQRNPPTPSD